MHPQEGNKLPNDPNRSFFFSPGCIPMRNPRPCAAKGRERRGCRRGRDGTIIAQSESGDVIRGQMFSRPPLKDPTPPPPSLPPATRLQTAPDASCLFMKRISYFSGAGVVKVTAAFMSRPRSDCKFSFGDNPCSEIEVRRGNIIWLPGLKRSVDMKQLEQS